MSVYQVEQYYIHNDIKKSNVKIIKKYLEENGLDDYEIQSDDTITVDGFECEHEAWLHEANILNLNK